MLRDRYPSLTFIPMDDYQSDKKWAQTIDYLLGDTYEWTGHSGQDGFWNAYHKAGGKWRVEVVLQDGPLSESTKRREAIGADLKIDNLDKRQALIWTAHNLRDQVFPTVDILCIKNSHATDASVIVGRKPNETLFRFPGGFVDVTDQSLLDAAKREFSEEVPGIEVGDWAYVTSRKINDWRFTGSQGIMTTVFTCTYVFGSLKAGDDLNHVQWARIESMRPELMVPEHRPLAELLLKEL